MVNIDDGTLSVVRGRGDGTFESQDVYGVGTVPRGLAVLDADGDGDIDLAVTDADGGRIELFANVGDGTFSPPAVPVWPFAPGPWQPRT